MSKGFGKCCSRYYKFRLALTLMSLSVMIIAISLYFGDSNIYGQIVANETLEWNQGAIIDIQPVPRSSIQEDGQPCPDDYSLVTGKFYGTESVCKNGDTIKEIGKCSGDGSQQDGMPLSDLNSFNNTMLCVKRSSSNYHTYAAQRGQQCTQPCGDANDPEKSFCSSDECPLNAIHFIYRPDFSSISYNYTSHQGRNFSTFWLLNQVQNLAGHTPLVNFHISMSQPCGYLPDNYMKRPVKINKAYRDSETCHFNYNQNQHDGYTDSEFKQEELYVYKENNLEQSIKSYIGSTYDSKELLKNSYKIYYKSYSLWSLKCQGQYSTKQISEQGENMRDISNIARAVYITSIVAFVFEIISLMAYSFKLCIDFDGDNRIKKFFKTYFFPVLKVKFVVLKFLLAFIILIQFLALEGNLDIISQTITQYMEDNLCSDDLLNFAITKFNKAHKKDLSVGGVGVAFSLVSVILQVAFTICTTKFFKKKCCKGKLDDEKEPPLESPKEIKDKYSSLSKRGSQLYDQVNNISMVSEIGNPPNINEPSFELPPPDLMYDANQPQLQFQQNLYPSVQGRSVNKHNNLSNNTEEASEQVSQNDNSVVFTNQNEYKSQGNFQRLGKYAQPNHDNDEINHSDINIEDDDDDDKGGRDNIHE